MKESTYMDVDKMHQLVYKLSHSEFNVLLFVIFYMSSHHLDEYVNSASTREQMASMGFTRTPERICAILSSLVKKGVLKRESPGSFTLVDKLFLRIKNEDILP